jgi:hypothetical protein
LQDAPHHLNLITIKRESELPTDLARLRAAWPGPVFEFKPEYQGVPSADIDSINRCLALAAGMAPGKAMEQSPLSMLSWAKTSHGQLMAKPVAAWGEVVSSNQIRCFKGSNECSTSLALKAHLVSWVRKIDPGRRLEFECFQDEDGEENDEAIDEPNAQSRRRIDLRVEGIGHFEFESMRGSGPAELFYQKKVFSRVKAGVPFHLVVPNEAVLWAGTYLSDLAYHLAGKDGHVMVPSADGSFLEIAGDPLPPVAELLLPEETGDVAGTAVTASAAPIRLQDVAGYDEVKHQIDEFIIWPEKRRSVLRPASRSSGVLFFGPPGCGKSRWAKAIAGELSQEVRLLAPSDLRGPYIGWGQIMIREQFDWLAENDKRLLIIDELDAVARSRRESQMHTDDMASVNELLVQIDRVLALGRLIVAATNFIRSMDEAVLRSGRFGHFIPVAPPDVGESVDIVDFYLRRLVPTDPQSKLKVDVPDRTCLESIVRPLYSENLERGKFFCGADLEAAVNQAYLRSAREALPDDGWTHDLEVVEIHLTEEDLTRSPAGIPRSVQKGAVDLFLEDVGQFCDRGIAESITRRLRPRGVS